MTSTDTAAVDRTSSPTFADDAPSQHRDASLELIFDERCQEVVELLSRRWWRWRRPWDAERRNNLSRILADLGEARRLDAAHRLPPGTRAHLRTLLRRRVGTLTFDGIVETRDELRKALLPIGDEAYVSALLEDERVRQAVRTTAGGSSAILWRDIHGTDAREGEVGADRLLAFAAARREQYREDRKRVRLRQHALLSIAPVLALLTLVSAVVTAMLMDGEHPGSTVLLVVCAGGLGAVLGSLRPVREEVTAGADLRAYLPAVVVEPLLGAVAGLLSLMIGETGVLGPTTADGDVWARAGLLAFAAGFAEPLVLRAISRLAGMPGDDLGRRPAVAHRPNPDGDDAPGRSPATRQGEVPKPRRRNGGATASAPSAAPSKRADRVRRSDSTPGPA